MPPEGGWVTERAIKTNKSISLPDLSSDHRQQRAVKTVTPMLSLACIFHLRVRLCVSVWVWIYLCYAVACISDNCVASCVKRLSQNFSFISCSPASLKSMATGFHLNNSEMLHCTVQAGRNNVSSSSELSDVVSIVVSYSRLIMVSRPLFKGFRCCDTAVYRWFRIVAK